MNTQPTLRCSETGLTRAQVLELIDAHCRRTEMSNGVIRSLRLRGLLTFDRRITEEGYLALEHCTFLAPDFRQWLVQIRA